MTRAQRSGSYAVTMALALCWCALQAALAQQQQWQTETERPQAGSPPTAPALPSVLPNTTVVPRAAQQAATLSSGPPGQLSLAALLTQDGQSIDQGLVWRIYRAEPGRDGKPQLLATHREASPVLRLEPGTYLINAAFGRANLTRRVTVSAERAVQERFVLNAGGLRLISVLTSGEAVSERAVVYDIYSDERDQYGQRTRVMSAVRPGIVLRLNAGIYNVVATYGDANAIARADVTVEAGKLTEATITHAAARVTFRLVARPGGDAIADTQWTVATGEGETIKETVGALPTHTFAPGTYTVSAKNGGEVFHRQFVVQAGDVVHVEVLRR